MKCTKTGSSKALGYTKIIRAVLIKNPEGICLRDMSRITGIGDTSLLHILHDFFKGSIKVKREGRKKLIFLLKLEPSARENRLLQREEALRKAKELRKSGYAISEISKTIEKEFGFRVHKPF